MFARFAQITFFARKCLKHAKTETTFFCEGGNVHLSAKNKLIRTVRTRRRFFSVTSERVFPTVFVGFRRRGLTTAEPQERRQQHHRQRQQHQHQHASVVYPYEHHQYQPERHQHVVIVYPRPSPMSTESGTSQRLLQQRGGSPQPQDQNHAREENRQVKKNTHTQSDKCRVLMVIGPVVG